MSEHFSNSIISSGETKIQFHLKFCLFFSLLFFISIVVGTITHEFGHILVAKFLGYSVKLDYHSMEWYARNSSGFSKPQNHNILVTMGGVLMTILISFISFYLLLKEKLTNLKFWLLFFCSLFISRQIVNLFMSILGKLLFMKPSYFGGDELALSQMFNLYDGSVSIFLAIIAILVCYYLVFKILPKKYLISFFVGGLFGGALGYYLWFFMIGPFLLPAID